MGNGMRSTLAMICESLKNSESPSNTGEEERSRQNSGSFALQELSHLAFVKPSLHVKRITACHLP